jgi:anthranilate phosphoribosyltransferase
MQLADMVGPNEEFLEAQARVCTGPHQTRPLGRNDGDPDPARILELILQTLRGELPYEEQVSPAQIGAFFAAMTIRHSFPEATRWSAAEQEAFERYKTELDAVLPEPCQFLLAPERPYNGTNLQEKIVVAGLGRILQGEHLSYDTTRQVLEAMLSGEVDSALAAAVLIGQRMNLESYDEVRGYLDAVLAPDDLVAVKAPSLTHFGQPFDGAARYFRPTPFVAAVRAALGRPSVLHGVDQMPPKSGVTDEQILAALGAHTQLSRLQAASLIEQEKIGFAYVSQREYAPAAYRLRDLRVHIKKRPPWAATEKAQQLFTCPGADYMVIGYYHAGYEEPLLRLMQERELKAGLVIKGEEGGCNYSLRLGKPSTPERKAINYSQGFRCSHGKTREFAADVDPASLGFAYEQSPRPKEINVQAFAQMGRAALMGEHGPIYDRIVLNAAMVDYWLGFEAEAQQAVNAARAAIDSGEALTRLERYIEYSQPLAG